MRSILLPGSFIAVLLVLPVAQSAAQDSLVANLERVITSAVDPDGPGAAVLIVKDGKVLLKKGYGLAELDKKTPVTADTTLELASGSKPITALAILLLERAGKLGLKDDIRKHVPELPVFEEKRPIRLVDLLQHTSGLPDPLDSLTLREGSTADFVKATGARKLLFATGSRHQYCNMNYRLLAVVVERVSGKSFGTYLHDSIFAPLGMKRTVVRETSTIIPANRAKGYGPGGLLDGGKKYRLGENDFLLLGEAGIWSCLDDLQKLDAAISSGTLLDTEMLKRAWTRGKLDDGTAFNFGLGWYVVGDKRGPLVSHSGGRPGFESQHLRLIDHKLTVIVLRNWFHLHGGNSAVQIADRLFRVVMDGTPTLENPPTFAQRKQLVGSYQLDNDKETRTAAVGEVQDGLTLRLPFKEQPYALLPVGASRFALLGLPDGFFVRFDQDGDQVKTLTLERPKPQPTLVFRLATGLTYGVKDFDRETADKVAGKVWVAKLPLPPNGKETLRVAFRLVVQDSLLTGVLDSPDEDMFGIELHQLRLNKTVLAFAWPAVGSRFEGTLSADGKEIAGHWQQGFTKIPVRFTPAK